MAEEEAREEATEEDVEALAHLFTTHNRLVAEAVEEAAKPYKSMITLLLAIIGAIFGLMVLGYLVLRV